MLLSTSQPASSSIVQTLLGCSLVVCFLCVGGCTGDAPETLPRPAPAPSPSVPPAPSDGGTVLNDGGSTNPPRSDGGQVPSLDAGFNANDGGLVAEQDAGPGPETMQISVVHNLKWKRDLQFLADLGSALSLTNAELCNEVGTLSCGTLHQVALGGNAPFVKGQYTPVATPGITSPVATDRVVLAACHQRVTLDQTSALVFTQLDLNTPVAAENPGVDVLITDLYHRFMQRDPLPQERSLLHTLTVDGSGTTLTGADFALLACFAVGSSSEMSFY